MTQGEMMKTKKNPNAHAPKAIKAKRPSPAPVSSEVMVKQLMQRFELAFESRDIDGVLACVGPGFEWRMPDGQCVRGRRAFKKALTERFGRANGPRFSKSRFKYYGQTVIQTYRVALPDGKGGWLERRGCDVYKVRGGQLVRKDAFWKLNAQS